MEANLAKYRMGLQGRGKSSVHNENAADNKR